MMKDGTYKPVADLRADDPEIEDIIFFGLVNGFELEYGYFTLSELEQSSGGLQLPIECDLHFTPKSLAELRELHEREGDT